MSEGTYLLYILLRTQTYPRNNERLISHAYRGLPIMTHETHSEQNPRNWWHRPFIHISKLYCSLERTENWNLENALLISSTCMLSFACILIHPSYVSRYIHIYVCVKKIKNSRVVEYWRTLYITVLISSSFFSLFFVSCFCVMIRLSLVLRAFSWVVHPPFSFFIFNYL